MNERIKELAEQAGIFREFAVTGLWLADDEELVRFAELIRADEREACAKLCENVVSNLGYVQAKYCADAIKARGAK